MGRLIDRFGREINYLRISVTDRCNLRCIYCMPASGIFHKNQHQILSLEEIYKIVKTAASLGIRKVRITGGEPLVRKNVPFLIERMKTIEGIEEIGLTTNGIYLAGCASSLKDAGLDRINVSIDSLVPQKFSAMTRGGSLAAALEGVESALSAGFASVKINTVLLKGFNACEVLDFANLARIKPLHVRFIEYMPTDTCEFSYNDLFSSAVDAKDIVSSFGKLVPVRGGDAGVANVYTIKNFRGTIGFIAPMSAPFCGACNKLRLTSDGRLRSCLHSSEAVDVKKAIREGAGEEEIALLIKKTVAMKPRVHHLAEKPLGHGSESFSMCQIGG